MNTLSHLIGSVHALHSQLTGSPTPQEPPATTTPMNLIIMGEINKGKSTFINALLGTPGLLPTGDSVTTSAVFKVRYGNTISYTVHFLPNAQGHTPAPQTIAADAIRDFGTETGNPRNHKQVDYIEATAPAPLLAGGIEITDTPGLGGILRYHSRNTWRHLPSAHAIIFVTSSTEAPIGTPEQENIVQAAAITRNLIFVQTKKDAQDTPALQRREANNRAIIAAALGIPAKAAAYFCVSSHIKQRCDKGEISAKFLRYTGFPELTDFLQNTLLSTHSSIDTSKCLLSLAPQMEDIARHLQSRRAALEATTCTQKNTLLQELHRQKLQLDEWEKTQLPLINNRLEKAINHLYIECKEEAAAFKLHYHLHHEFKSQILAAPTLLELEKTLNAIQEKLPNQALSAILRIRSTVETKLSTIMLQLLEDVQQADTHTTFTLPHYEATPELSLYTQEIGNISHNLQNRKEIWRRLQSTGCKGIMGAAANNGVLNLIGAVAGVTLPGVGVVILSATAMVAGGLWGFFFTHKKNNTSLLQETKTQALTALEAAMGSTHHKIKSMLGSICNNYRKHYGATITQFLAERRQFLQEQTQKLSLAPTTATPNIQELSALEKAEQEFNRLRSAIRRAAAH